MNRSGRRQVAAALAALWLAGCGAVPQSSDAGRPPADAGADSDAGPVPTVTALVALNANNVFGAIVSINAANATSFDYVYGEFTPEDGFAQQGPMTPMPASGSMTFPIIGLAPGELSHVTVTVYNTDGQSTASQDQRFQVPPLPEGFPVPMGGVPTATLVDDVLVGIAQQAQSHGLTISRGERLLWDRIAGVGTSRGLDFEFQTNGDFTFYRADEMDFEELDLAANIVRHWSDPMAALGTDGHRLLFLPDGNSLLMGRGSHMENLSSFGGSSDATVYDLRIDEVDPAGNIAFSWLSTADELDSDTPGAILAGPSPVDALLPMGLDVDAGGNAVVALANTGSVLNISRPGAQVQWRLGGVRNEFTFPRDSLNGPAVPMAVRVLATGNILLLDSVPAQSLTRAVEYQLDTTARTATLVWEYRDTTAASTEGGSVEREADGSTLVAWGDSGLVQQIGPAGDIVWSMQVDAAALSASAAQVIP